MGFNTPWWEHLKTKAATITGDAIVDSLQTKKIGVSANVSSDQTLTSNSEERLNIDDTSQPYFDDFGELDAAQNEIVVKHDSHHEIKANAYIQSATGPGEVWLRIYLNGTQRAKDHMDAKNGEMLIAGTSVNLKLEEGDKVWATIEHNTGGTETFPGGTDGNYLSCIRQ